MGEDPRAIRSEIEDTRERMGDTVDALAYKADVKSRAKESVSEKVENVKEKITGAKDSVTESVTGAKDSVAGTVSDRTPDAQQVKQGARQAVGVAQENPLGLAIGSVAVGFVIGMLLPTTKVEEEKIAPVAGQVREKAIETGQEALEHGKQAAQQVAETGKEAVAQAVDQTREAAKESGQQHAQEVKETAQQKAGETRDEVRS
jgi:hypothetical protein